MYVKAQKEGNSKNFFKKYVFKMALIPLIIIGCVSFLFPDYINITILITASLLFLGWQQACVYVACGAYPPSHNK